MKILVVEDSLAVRIRVVARLREAGLMVVGEAGTIAEAALLVARLVPDAVLLDMKLPDGSGLSLVPMLKALVPVPVVAVLTIEHAYREECLARGVDLFFDKATEVEAAVTALVGWR